MTTDGFVEFILFEYEAFHGHRLKSAERAVAKEYILSDVPRENLPENVSRKLAAMILHKSLQRLTKEPDDDWGEARNFKDIYDCRVCANAAAQVSVKGILQPVSDDKFGMTEILPEEELKKAAERVFFSQKRLTKLLELENVGNR